MILNAFKEMDKESVQSNDESSGSTFVMFEDV